jgi:hypothetical protein
MKRDESPINALAIQPISRDVLQEKYLKPGEADVEDLFARVAWHRSSRNRNERHGRPASTATCAPGPSAPAAS